MRRNTLNFTVDTLALVGMVAMTATGLVIRYTLPPGSGGREGGRASTLWGLSRHGWGDVHFWIAVGIAAMLLLHVFLHWQWVWKTVFHFLSSRSRVRRHLTPAASKFWGLGFFLLVAGVIASFLWIADASVQTVDAGRPVPRELIAGDGEVVPGVATQRDVPDAHDEHGENEELIRGSMTLRDVSAATGISVDLIKKSLELPSNVSSNERLGRLKREYGLEMSELRRFVAEQMRSSQPTKPDSSDAVVEEGGGL